MEEINVVYNVHHEIPLGVLLANYFYMTGLSAGSFILSTLAYGFGIKKYKPIGKVGVVLATLLLVLAPLNLLIDMTLPWRFWHLFVYLNPTSPITWGSFLLIIYPLNCIIYGYFMFKGDEKKTKVFGLIGIPLALSVHGYTGFILALAKRGLINTALMPTLFLVSAMVSGIALMILVVIVKDRFFSAKREVDRELIFDLGKILAWSIVTDLVLIFSDVSVLLTSEAAAYEAAQLILRGSFAPYFLGVEIFLGSLVPLFLLFFPKTRRTLTGVAIASALVMIGIFVMRYVMVIGGQSIPQS
ncbi:MAG: polysulfide reductase NrfD [candidate division NC10 bacterium]|nr:polysulfide reductase NrfD [candidate division NC10 bacterium]